MTSAIDPTKPADGIPASKMDLRDNLLAAQTEIDHGGFATGSTPSNYAPSPADEKVTSHLAGIDAALAANAFLDLSDAPSDYSGDANKFVKVKGTEDGLEFVSSSVSANADAVEYDPPWTGVSTRSVEARLMDEAHVDDFGAVGDGAADDAGAIQEAVDSPASFVVFGPKSYAIGTRIDVPQGKVLVFKGATISGHGNLPTTGDASALFWFDGSTPTSLRGNSVYGAASFSAGGRARYGWSVGPSGNGPSRFDVYGGPLVFQNGFSTAIRSFGGGWWAASLRGITINAQSANNIAIDWQDSDGTTLLLERIAVGCNGSTGTGVRGYKLESNSIAMINCSCDGTPAGAAAIECVQSSAGGRVNAYNLHLEGNEGHLVRLGASSNNQFRWFGGHFHVPSEHTGTLLDIGGGAKMSLWDVSFQAFTNWSTFASIGGGGLLSVYECGRDLSASSPWNQFTGSGEAFQLFKGKRSNLHNSP